MASAWSPRSIMLSDSAAYVLALFVRATLYGFYIATLVPCLRWLLSNDREWKSWKQIDKRLLSITIFILIFLSTSVGFAVRVTLGLVQGIHSSRKLNIVKVRSFYRISFIDS